MMQVAAPCAEHNVLPAVSFAATVVAFDAGAAH